MVYTRQVDEYALDIFVDELLDLFDETPFSDELWIEYS